MERIRTAIDPLTMGRNSEEVKSLFYEVHELALLAGDYIQQSKKWDEMTSAGFLQHYEMPSEFLDFTGSLKTALGFALWNVAQKSPLIVYLCVAETEILASDALLVDFAALMRSAPRPRLQNGFGVYGKHRDLKGAEAVEAYGLRWFAVHATFEDLAINALDPNLLDLASDEAAGFMKWILDLAVEDRGKLSTAIAKYLAERVAAVDPIKKDMGDGVSIHISHTEAGKPFNAEKQKQQNFDDWRISDE